MIFFGIAVGLVVAALSAFIFLSKSQRMNYHGVPLVPPRESDGVTRKRGERIAVTKLVAEIYKRLPVTPQGSWHLNRVEHGLSVWEHQRDNFFGDGTVHACCAVVRAPVQTVVNTLEDHSLRVHWDSAVKSVHTVATGGKTVGSTSTQHHDLVAIVPKFRPHFSLMRNSDLFLTLSRTWQQHAEYEWAWMLWQNLNEPVVDDVTWSFALASPLQEGQSSVVYMTCMPTSLQLPELTAVRLAGLRQYIECQFIADHIASLPSVTGGESSLCSSTRTDTPQMVNEMSSPLSVGEDTEEESFASKLTDDQQRYMGILQEAFDDLLEAGLGGPDDGWQEMGKTKGVTLMKNADQGAVNSVKGTGVIHAPASLILDWIDDFNKVKQWDDMFQEGDFVERISRDFHVDHLMYKPQWPTSARDFCVVAGRRKEKDGTWLCGTRSIVHPSCPPVRSCVRAKVIDGGYILRPLPDSTNSYEVTYVTKVDLKGNIPSMVVNKVTQNAPLCVATLRDLVQQAYAEEQAKERRRQLVEEMLAAKQQEKKDEEGDQQEDEEKEDEEPSESTVPGHVTDQSIEYPMVDPAHVDYRTLGNQAAAGLLAELLLASDVDIYQPTSSEVYGGWKYDGVEKNVVILKKQLSASENYFMGKGIIPLPVSKVWGAVHEPRTRFAYDPMLKELRVVEDLGGRVMILYMLLQAQQCLLKQARDFCFLHSERVEHDKHIVAAQSVEHSGCPEVPGIQRGVIYASGWCVEPIMQDGTEHSMVTYLGRVDVKGPTAPGFVVDYVRRQQTLNVANLAKYLKAFTVPVFA